MGVGQLCPWALDPLAWDVLLLPALEKKNTLGDQGVLEPRVSDQCKEGKVIYDSKRAGPISHGVEISQAIWVQSKAYANFH